MRKVFLAIMLLAVAISGFAKKKYLSVVSGNIAVLSQKNKTAIDEFDYSKTYIEGKPSLEYLTSHGSDYLKDWPNDNVVTETSFFNAWNEEIKKDGVQLVRADKADYRIVIHVDSLDLGSTGGAMFGLSKTAGGCIIYGTVDVIDCANGNVACKIKIDNLKGNGSKFFDVSTNENRRRGLAYEKLAKQIVELIKDK